ncbi:SDR family oxidoreductase [Cytobacillus spongiae]|uniref:SDR family oxidoreductase n=1 Tax=Cytobacillus spongiae TaxID=2901381 RepID=UPI001F454FD1|nr:SDR family oxidoreductase [Cytobacillus spongiae]UII54176.1 SDR family oxidoreductase [Cytobacillus spongiae]
MKTAIVTGGSSGFGLLTTIKLAKAGFKVVSTYRTGGNEVRMKQELELQQVSDQVIIKKLDVTSQESLQHFHQVVDSLERIDVLVNNAGMAVGGFSEEVPLHAYRTQFETNVFGAIAVTQLVLPKMRQQTSGKIINMSSISGLVGFPGLSAYSASKHALEGWSESLRLELAPFHIDVFIVEPGSYHTNIWTTGTYIPAEADYDSSPYNDMMNQIKKVIEKSSANYGDPIEVATLVTDIATGKKGTTFRYPVGKGIGLTLFFKKLIPWKWWEKAVKKQIKMGETDASRYSRKD